MHGTEGEQFYPKTFERMHTTSDLDQPESSLIKTLKECTSHPIWISQKVKFNQKTFERMHISSHLDQSDTQYFVDRDVSGNVSKHR